MSARSFLQAAGAVLGLLACSVPESARVAQTDPIMDRLCSISPVFDREAFHEDRVEFSWLGTTGRDIAAFPVQVPGLELGDSATFEEMGIQRSGAAAALNAAIGAGRAWYLGPPATVGVFETQSLPTPHAPSNVVRFEVRPYIDEAECRPHDNLVRILQEGAKPREQRDLGQFRPGVAQDFDDILREFDRAGELPLPEALATLRSRRASGQCLVAQSVPQSALRLRAFRGYEVFRDGGFEYALSPHLVTRDDQIVFFSMAVVRSTIGHNRNIPDPGGRSCCVSLIERGCSRYGGPDPYSMISASWSHRNSANQRRP